MTRWEYCEAVWQPEQVALTIPVPDEETPPTFYPAEQYHHGQRDCIRPSR